MKFPMLWLSFVSVWVGYGACSYGLRVSSSFLLKLLNQIYKSVSMTNNLSWSMNSFPLCRSRVSEMEGAGSLLCNSAAPRTGGSVK